MTIAVTVQNDDRVLSIEVTPIEFERGSPKEHRGAPVQLRPGESRTFHCHLLRTFEVRQMNPDHEARRAAAGETDG